MKGGGLKSWVSPGWSTGRKQSLQMHKICLYSSGTDLLNLITLHSVTTSTLLSELVITWCKGVVILRAELHRV